MSLISWAGRCPDDRLDGGLGAIADGELLEDRGEMVLDRFLRDVQTLGQLVGGGHSDGQELQDLLLPFRERGRPRVEAGLPVILQQLVTGRVVE